VAEEDPNGPEGLELQDRRVLLLGLEFSGRLGGLTSDDDCAVVRIDNDRLVAGRVAGGDDAKPRKQVTVSVKQLVVRAREVDPVRQGVPWCARRLVLSALDEDRPTRKELVAAAVIEVEVRVNDETDVGRRQADPGERFLERVADGFIEAVDEFVRWPDARVHEDGAIRVSDEERKDGAGLAVARVALGINDISEMQRVDRGGRIGWPWHR